MPPGGDLILRNPTPVFVAAKTGFMSGERHLDAVQSFFGPQSLCALGHTCHRSDVDHDAALSASVFAHVVQCQVGDPNDTHLHTRVLKLQWKCFAGN